MSESPKETRPANKQISKDTEMKSKISRIARNIFESILKSRSPRVEVPLRSLSNVTYSDNAGFFTIAGKTKERTLTASTIKTFAQTLRLMVLSKDLIDADDMATKREAYYVSKNWGDAMFKEQPESDNVMDDIEAMLYTFRESMGFIAGEKGGGLVAGDLIVVDVDPETKKPVEINCTKFGSGAYSIPSILEHFHFKTKAKYILAIETAGMFERLNKHKFWKKDNCILIGMGGVPTRSTRRFIRKLSDEHNLPVYVFTDG
ncbi:DNA topoisomerase VI, partial [Candidatus Woesearchaeota archaeon]